MNDNNKALIFGKDNTERIVAIEPSDGSTMELFIQNSDGSINSETRDLTHWCLFAEKYSPKFSSLKGNQHYKWAIEYQERNRLFEVVRYCKRQGYDYYAMFNPQESAMVKSGITLFKGLQKNDVSVLSFDLEHTFGIGDSLRRDGVLLLISNTFRDHAGNITKRLFAYDEFSSQREMVDAWCSWVRKMGPSIVIGHNIFGHDFKVLQYCANRNQTELRLGRNGDVLKWDNRASFKRKDASQAYEYFNAHIYGRQIIDTFFLAITYDTARNYETYGLKQIIKQEGLEKENRAHYDASKIAANYQIPEEWAKIKEYAKDDADDALALYDLMIPAYFYATQSIPRTLQHVINSATGGQINSMMVRSYFQRGHSVAKATEAKRYEGAISFGIPGLHKNVLRFDVASLYPSVIRTYKIHSEAKDPDQHFLSMVEYFTLERLKNKKAAKETKDRRYDDLSNAQKILINSMYGFMGSKNSNYNYPEGAEEVTRRGREVLKTAIYWATGQEYSGPLELERLEDSDEYEHNDIENE